MRQRRVTAGNQLDAHYLRPYPQHDLREGGVVQVVSGAMSTSPGPLQESISVVGFYYASDIHNAPSPLRRFAGGFVGAMTLLNVTTSRHCEGRGTVLSGGGNKHCAGTARVEISTLRCRGGRTAGVLWGLGQCAGGGNIYCMKYNTNPIESNVAGFPLRCIAFPPLQDICPGRPRWNIYRAPALSWYEIIE